MIKLIFFMLLCTCYVYSDSLIAQNLPEVNNDYCLKNNNLYVKNNKQLKTGTDDVLNSLVYLYKQNTHEDFVKEHDSILDIIYQLENSKSPKATAFISDLIFSLNRYIEAKHNNSKVNKKLSNLLKADKLYLLVIRIPQVSFSSKNQISVDQVNFNDNYNNELKLLKLIVTNEQSDLNSFFKFNITKNTEKSYTASDIQEIYDKNEVKGDLKFKGKQFYVTGAIASIDSSLNDQPAVHFATDTGNQFQLPTAFFKDYENKLEQIADLSKGQEIKLLCTGNGEMVGSPMLSDCEFAKSELDLYVDQIIKDNGDAVELKGGYDINNLYLSVKTLSSILSDDSACFNNEYDQCKTELLELPDYKIRAAANRYHLSRDKIHAAMRKEIDEVNQEMIKKYNNSKEINQVIEFKEKCYVPIVMNLF
jgi:hypothetical protein